MLHPDDRIVDEWFPVATASSVTPGSAHPFDLLDDRFVLLCDTAGAVTCVPDTCPHRGAQLSLGRWDGERLACPYHGWEFDGAGVCRFQPAQPTLVPPAIAGLRPIPVRLAYGLYWVCLGPNPRELPDYPAYGTAPGPTGWIGPERLGSCGPRIVENFLDMAHFPYVHEGYLGERMHAEVRPYGVEEADGGLRAVNCVFWQPRPGPMATAGGDVDYVYSVTHPYAATLQKVPSEAGGGELGVFWLMIVASPEREDRCRVWLLTTLNDPAGDIEESDAFNRVIFGQDIPIVESQRPVRLPIEPRAERHQPADRLSLAYRRWLVARGIRYGTSRNDAT